MGSSESNRTAKEKEASVQIVSNEQRYTSPTPPLQRALTCCTVRVQEQAARSHNGCYCNHEWSHSCPLLETNESKSENLWFSHLLSPASNGAMDDSISKLPSISPRKDLTLLIAVAEEGARSYKRLHSLDMMAFPFISLKVRVAHIDSQSWLQIYA